MGDKRTSFKSNTVYTFKKMLGAGGSADVFLCSRQAEGCPEQEIALKILRHNDESLLRELINDGEVLNQLQHPHILRTYGYEKTEDKQFALLLEYVDGPNLKTVISEIADQDRNSVASHLGAAMFEALALAHSSGIVHGDISSKNILISKGGDLKLADFGIASHFAKDNVIAPLKGSLDYIAPEIWKGERATAASDIFSLGMILYEIINGENPLSQKEVANFKETHFALQNFLKSRPWQKLPNESWLKFFEAVFITRISDATIALKLLPPLQVDTNLVKRSLATCVANSNKEVFKVFTQTITVIVSKININEWPIWLKSLAFVASVFLFFAPAATGTDVEQGRRLRHCLLTVTSQPWGEVFLNGKSYGYTPLVNVEIPSGYQNLLWKDFRGREWKRSLMAFDNGIFSVRITK